MLEEAAEVVSEDAENCPGQEEEENNRKCPPRGPIRSQRGETGDRDPPAETAPAGAPEIAETEAAVETVETGVKNPLAGTGRRNF